MAKDNTFSGMAHNALTAETTIVGKIVSQKDIRIDGTLKGQLECQGKVVIGETGQVIGDIVAVNAEVVGRVEGNVTVAEMLVLKATSSLEGDVEAHRLAIEPGAVLNGKCTMRRSSDEDAQA
ncbi:polymer-forming cytoskeletal protein [Barnesiella sp. An55]|uniref:bactofilin family protein n=1 Tax=Barnesiella sp. An55 TaxID=1965646 RepID=UPI000B3ADDDF|nr:polymer-forming cytoskeletal protein [Barnesiella sp. An55]OUN74269.1 hypothetical protein B5G10_01500 [Barnesiella sp. An55]